MLYFLFVFSMVVPFQMVMFTLSQTADSLKLNTPWNIWIIYLGFGAGLAVFMFAGFMKSIPLEIEEASMIDGCNPIQTYFMVVFRSCVPPQSQSRFSTQCGLERLFAAVSGNRQQVQDDPNCDSVPAGRLWIQGHGRFNGDAGTFDHPNHHFLSFLSEIYY